MVVGIICKNVFTSNLLLFNLLLAMPWFVLRSYSGRFVERSRMFLIIVRYSAVHLRGARL